MIVVPMVAEDNLGVRELETEVLHRFLDDRHIALVCVVHQDVAGWRNNEKGTQRLRAHVVDIADDFVRLDGSGLLLFRAHIAPDDRRGGVGLSVYDDGRMIRWPRFSSSSLRTLRLTE